MDHFTDKTPLRSHLKIRDIQADDLAQATEIYNFYVTNTTVTFDTVPFAPQQRQEWLDKFTPLTQHQCLVAELGNSGDDDLKGASKIVGYASSSVFRPKPAYQYSVETTIYLHQEHLGQGYGKLLYSMLLENLQQLGVHRAYGIVALPNDASVHLHKSLGFEAIGTLTEVGFKFNQYHDTLWLEKRW